MKQDIASPLSGTYKAVNSSLVYTKAEGCCLCVLEFSRKSARNKPLNSDFPACKLSDYLENPRTMSMFPDIQQFTIPEFEACLLLSCNQPHILSNRDKYRRIISDEEII